MANKNDKPAGCCVGGTDDDHDETQLDESAAEYGVEETNKKDGSA